MSNIELRNVVKMFGDTCILDHIDFEFEKYGYHVIVGDNGSGKTTLFKTMIGLMTPDEGQIYYDGIALDKNYDQILRKIGVILADDRTLYHKLTAFENLYYVGRIYGIAQKELKKRIEDLLKCLGLENDKKLVENYSTGMKKKLMIARALLIDPEYIFGDEIFNGLDEDAKMRVNDLLNQLYDQGKTIVLITHIMESFPKDAKVYQIKNKKLIRIDDCGKVSI